MNRGQTTDKDAGVTQRGLSEGDQQLSGRRCATQQCAHSSGIDVVFLDFALHHDHTENLVRSVDLDRILEDEGFDLVCTREVLTDSNGGADVRIAREIIRI